MQLLQNLIVGLPFAVHVLSLDPSPEPHPHGIVLCGFINGIFGRTVGRKVPTTSTDLAFDLQLFIHSDDQSFNVS